MHKPTKLCSCTACMAAISQRLVGHQKNNNTNKALKHAGSRHATLQHLVVCSTGSCQQLAVGNSRKPQSWSNLEWVKGSCMQRSQARSSTINTQANRVPRVEPKCHTRMMATAWALSTVYCLVHVALTRHAVKTHTIPHDDILSPATTEPTTSSPHVTPTPRSMRDSQPS
jgi:hypothetical protein